MERATMSATQVVRMYGQVSIVCTSHVTLTHGSP